MFIEKLNFLKNKFTGFFVNKKKLSALENYSSVAPFRYQKSLYLIKDAMEEGFLNEKGASFMNSMLDEYEISFLDWAHKTRWLKKKMKSMVSSKPKPIDPQIYFDFEKKLLSPSVPVSLIVPQPSKGVQRRA